MSRHCLREQSTLAFQSFPYLSRSTNRMLFETIILAGSNCSIVSAWLRCSLDLMHRAEKDSEFTDLGDTQERVPQGQIHTWLAYPRPKFHAYLTEPAQHLSNVIHKWCYSIEYLYPGYRRLPRRLDEFARVRFDALMYAVGCMLQNAHGLYPYLAVKQRAPGSSPL